MEYLQIQFIDRHNIEIDTYYIILTPIFKFYSIEQNIVKRVLKTNTSLNITI